MSLLSTRNLVQSEKSNLLGKILDTMGKLSQRAVWALNEISRGELKGDKLELIKEYYEECKSHMYVLERHHDFILYNRKDVDEVSKPSFIFNNL